MYCVANWLSIWISQALMKDTACHADHSLCSGSGLRTESLFLRNHPRCFWGSQFSFVGWGLEYLKVGQPHPVSLPLLYGCKAWTSNLQLFIHSLNIYWVLTINILFYKERTTGNKKWNKSVWLDQKYSYWTHPLSHHNLLLNLLASVFTLEMVQKRINVWRLQNKTAWSQILAHHLIRWLGQVTPQFWALFPHLWKEADHSTFLLGMLRPVSKKGI